MGLDEFSHLNEGKNSNFLAHFANLIVFSL